jgi:hypothetical protein
MDRYYVYKIIDGERTYQNRRHERHPVPHRDEDHSVADWLLYIEEHLARAKRKVYDLSTVGAMGEVRKITALGVACMEHIDAPEREKS